EQLVDAGVDEVIVVVGAEHALVSPLVTHPRARAVLNREYEEGRASSLRRGARALAESPERIVVLGVDQPRPAWVSRRLLEASRPNPGELRTGMSTSDPASAVVWLPLFGEHRSHPVVLDGSLLEELAAVDEETLGLRAVMTRHAGQAVSVPITPGPAPFD